MNGVRSGELGGARMYGPGPLFGLGTLFISEI